MKSIFILILSETLEREIGKDKRGERKFKVGKDSLRSYPQFDSLFFMIE